MKKAYLIFLLFGSTAFAETIAEWNFSSLSGFTNSVPATTYSSSILSSLPIVHTRPENEGYSNAGTWNMKSGQTQTINDALLNDTFFEFTLVPLKAINIDSISLRGYNQFLWWGFPAPDYYVYLTLFVSINGNGIYEQLATPFPITASNKSEPTTIEFNTPSLSNVASEISFRVYYYGGTDYYTRSNAFGLGNSSNNTVSGLQVNGSSIPEAQSAILICFGLVIVAAFNSFAKYTKKS